MSRIGCVRWGEKTDMSEPSVKACCVKRIRINQFLPWMAVEIHMSVALLSMM